LEIPRGLAERCLSSSPVPLP
jgi:NADPH:quinone reductase-like Zn-dependent oxidoreductase